MEKYNRDYYSKLVPPDLRRYVISLLKENTNHTLAFFMTDYKRKYAIIISNYEDIIDSNIFILNYHDEETRRILAEMMWHNEIIIQLRGKKYRYLARIRARKRLFFIPKTLYIRAEKYAGLQHRKYQLVDSLIYSPKTNRYEILRGSYDEKNEILFFAPNNYLKFIEKYGNPDMDLQPSQNESRNFEGGGYSNRKNWSIFSLFGYSVDKSDGLSSNQRQDILVQLIEHGLATVGETVRFLDGRIREHKADKYQAAREKWTEDLEFIENYEVQPDGMAIL